MFLVMQNVSEGSKKPELKTVMAVRDVVALVRLMEDEDIDMWLDGGWAVDALLGIQTRPHEDVDIVIQQKDVPRLRELLAARGYTDAERPDTSAWNFVLGDSNGHLVDIHAVVFDSGGNGLYGPLKEGVMYPAASFTGSGTIHGYPVTCVSAEQIVQFHSAYEPDENDIQDVSALCELFGIAYPKEFARPKK